MSILDEFRVAIKKNKKDKNEDEKKTGFMLAGSEENKLRELEARISDAEDILEKLEEMKIDTQRIREKIKETAKNII